MKKFAIISFSLLFVSQLFGQNPKNIIVVMANGMGYNHLTALEKNIGAEINTDNYSIKYGVTNYPAYSNYITEVKDVKYFTGDYHIRRIWTEFDYAKMATDPSSAGTAIATGVKTGLGAVGVDIDSTALETILERATKLNKSTGIITDIALPLSAAASFAAHNPSSTNRTNIFRDLLASDLTYIAGAGNPAFNDNGESQLVNYEYISEEDFNNTFAGDTVYTSGFKTTDIDNDGISDKWRMLIDNDAIQSITGNRLLILPEVHTAIQYKRTGADALTNVPTLSSLTLKGLNLLSKNTNGFVAIVESNSIDYASGLQDKEKTIANLKEFNNTINDINFWVENNSSWDETLVIVVGTYETGYLTSDVFDQNAGKPDYLYGDYKITEGAEGATPNMTFQYSGQTKLLTPVFANGAGSELFKNYVDEDDFVFGPYINNSEIGQICLKLLPDPAVTPVKPKNIILMINDGGGYNQMQAANLYTGTTQLYQNFPVQLYHSTYPLITDEGLATIGMWNNSYESNLAWTDKTYLRDRNNGTCSGASGTAISSGKKTYYYSLGVDYDRNAMNTIARHAKENMQKSIGVAVNCRITAATPAVFFANNVSRNNYEEIFRQLIIESKADVLIGGGHPEFDTEGLPRTAGKYNYTGDEEMWEDLKANNTIFRSPSNSGWTEIQDIDGDNTPDPWTLVEDSASFVSLMTGDTPKRILGLAPVSSGLQFYRTGINTEEVHFDDWNKNMPELWQLSRVALNSLSKNANGFFLMIEGDMGDNASHQNYNGRLIEEQMVFNKTVDSVVSWIEANGGWDENLLIVTADHETGLLAHPDYNTDSIFLNHHELGDNGVGNIPAMKFHAGHHSNQLIPLFAKGAGSEVFNSYADESDYVRGKYLNNSEIGQAMFELWDGKACTKINNRPIIVSDIPAIDLTVGVDTTFSIPLSYFYDEEETELTFSVGARPSYLTIDDLQNLTFSGTPTSAGGKKTVITVTDGTSTGAAISIETSVLIRASNPPVGIEDNIKPSISAYPNPAVSVIKVKVALENGTISLINSQGQIVKTVAISSLEEVVSLQGVSAGSYTIKVETADGNTSQQKIIIR